MAGWVCNSLFVFFFVMLFNINFTLSHLDNLLFAMKPNFLIMILLLLEMEELMQVGAQLSFVVAYFSISFAFLTICQLWYCLDWRFHFCNTYEVRIAEFPILCSEKCCCGGGCCCFGWIFVVWVVLVGGMFGVGVTLAFVVGGGLIIHQTILPQWYSFLFRGLLVVEMWWWGWCCFD